MTREIICDTTFYFSPVRSILEDVNLRVVGTKWNAWELITSSRFKVKGFEYLKKAATNFLSIPQYYIKQTPIEYNMNGQYGERSEHLSTKSYNAILKILQLITEADKIEAYQETTEYIMFREYDNRARRDMEEFLRACIIKARELSEEYDPQLMYEIFKLNFREMTYDWYRRHFKILIYKNNIPSDPKTPFIQVLLAYFEDLFAGSTSVGKNDFNDLMHLIYLRNRYYFNTSEKNWIKYIESVYDGENILVR